ncbi:MAG TPA: polyphenol oxidase family protein [Acidimicrobiia bacterium]
MISPPGWGGVAFSDGSDGDLRRDRQARADFVEHIGLSAEWATVNQVHGDRVVEAGAGGPLGDADAIWTMRPGLPIAIFTADCFGVIALAPAAVGVAHTGWRGASAGVVDRMIAAMSEAGQRPSRLAIGPGIGPCCFEVGPEVAARFGSHHARTTWGTESIDLARHITSEVPADIDVWSHGGCTMHETGWFSHRGSGTEERMAAVAWI